MKAQSKEFVGTFQQWYAARPRYHRTECLDLIGNSAVTIRDYGTIVHKRKLVLKLMQRGFPTNHPPRWLALYGYLQSIISIRISFLNCQFFYFRSLLTLHSVSLTLISLMWHGITLTLFLKFWYLDEKMYLGILLQHWSIPTTLFVFVIHKNYCLAHHKTHKSC